MCATTPAQIDAITLAALADELQATLGNARVDDVIQPSPHSIAIQLYGGGRNRWLIVSAHPQFARIHLLNGKPRKIVAEPTPWVMLLRKHLEGARLVKIEQPAWERVIALGFGRGPEAAEGATQTWLIAEIMARFSNIILTNEQRIILGALRLATAETNQYRTILPHQAYREPPPQTRTLEGATLPQLPPEDVTASDLQAAFTDMQASRAAAADAPQPKKTNAKARRANAPLTVATVIAAHVRGFGRELARENAARALSDPDMRADAAVDWEAVARETRALAAIADDHAWTVTQILAPAATPTGATDDAEASDAEAGDADTERPIAVTVYEPHIYPANLRRERIASLNDALARIFADIEWRNELDQAKGDLRRILQTQRDRCLRKAEALAKEQADLEEAQKLRREADALLAFQSEIAPNIKSATIPDVWSEQDGATLTITLDPRFDAVENANRRYTKYHKLQRAGDLLPEQIESNTVELARIEQLLNDLALAESAAEVVPVRAEVAEAGYIRGGAEQRRLEKQQRRGGAKKNRMGKGGKPLAPRPVNSGQPIRRRLSGDLIALVGKNSRQNEEITFHQAGSTDLWLHIRGAAGSHVVLKTGGRPAPEDALREAAALAAWYSQLRGELDAQVDYTEARYVRHMKGGGPGLVTYERERGLRVAPADAGVAVK